MKRVKTGINGLDLMLNGGLIEGRPYLVVGAPGTGKSILGMHFLMQGLKEGEKGLLIAFEESKEELVENYREFGWSLDEIEIAEVSPQGEWFELGEYFERPEPTIEEVMHIKQELKNILKSTNAKRVVIDSIDIYRMVLRDPYYTRLEILSLMISLFKRKITSLYISGIESNVPFREEYLARGVIRMHSCIVGGEKKRGIEIVKMRGSKIEEQIRPFEITSNGIVVYNELKFY